VIKLSGHNNGHFTWRPICVSARGSDWVGNLQAILVTIVIWRIPINSDNCDISGATTSLFRAENAGIMLLQNFGIYLQVHTALQPRRLTTTSSPPWEPQTLVITLLKKTFPWDWLIGWLSNLSHSYCFTIRLTVTFSVHCSGGSYQFETFLTTELYWLEIFVAIINLCRESFYILVIKSEIPSTGVRRAGRKAKHSLSLVPRLRMHGAIPPLPPSAAWRGT
jgi:hypothetical protein